MRKYPFLLDVFTDRAIPELDNSSSVKDSYWNFETIQLYKYGQVNALWFMHTLAWKSLHLSAVLSLSWSFASVPTGKYREGDEATIHPAPSALCENFAEAVEQILSSINT